MTDDDDQRQLFQRPTANYSSTTFPTPHPFQDTAHEKLRDGFRAGHHKQILVAPTGSGKTFIGLRVSHESLAKGRRALFVCDRTALIEQTSQRADEYGLAAHGIVQAKHWRRDPSQRFQIASVQTISARGFWPDADVAIIDECHTQYQTVRDYLTTRNVAVIGLTATPCSRGLGLLYSNMVNAATMDELTKSGVLVPMRVLTCVKPDMTGAETNSIGEWTEKAAAAREAQIIGDVVAEWIAHAENRKTIAFGADIAYCEELARRFNESGVNADTFTSETLPAKREALLTEFRKPDSQIRILISVEALAKGFDVQDIGCVIDARPLRKSLSTAIQMWGRGLRSSVDTGKTECLILDHSGNFLRFYNDFVDVYFNGFHSLDMAEKLDGVVRKDEEEFEANGCPACGHKPFLRSCMACGFKKQTTVMEDSSSGEMREIRIGNRVIAADTRDLWCQLCAYVRGVGNPETQRGRAYHLFRDITGAPPPRDWNFDQTENAPINRGTINKIKSLRIAFIKGKENGQKRREALL